MSRTIEKLPAAVYAAAGAGELAYQQLRRLPEVAARTVRTAGERAEALRERLRTGDTDLTAGLEQVRESARTRVNTLAAQAATAQERLVAQAATAQERLVAQAATAQEKAVTGYRQLVARGERLVNDRIGVTTGHADAARPPRKVKVEVGEPRRDQRAGTAGTAASAASTGKGAGGDAATTPAGGGSTAGSSHRGVGKTGNTSAAKNG